MRLDPEVLARIQFAFTVTFHIIFPTMSIGLAAFPPDCLGRLILEAQPDFSFDRSRDCYSGRPRLFGFRLQRVPRQDAREGLGGMNPRFRRVIWFAGIYLMSIGTIAIVALVIRIALRHIT